LNCRSRVGSVTSAPTGIVFVPREKRGVDKKKFPAGNGSGGEIRTWFDYEYAYDFASKETCV
jgi:hypothetical protein